MVFNKQSCIHCRELIDLDARSYRPIEKGLFARGLSRRKPCGKSAGARDIGYAAQRGGSILSQTFEGKSPEWQIEHEKAFEMAKNGAVQHPHGTRFCGGCGTKL